MLIDLDVLSKTEKSKYITFMEIRNQFMHNLRADSFVTCYNYIEGKEKFVLNLFPQSEELTKEEKLENATLSLAKELTSKTIHLIEKIKEKRQNRY